MAKKLEEHLYRSAHNKDEYLDLSSLKRRMHLIAKGVGVPSLMGLNDPPFSNQDMSFLMGQNDTMQPQNSMQPQSVVQSQSMTTDSSMQQNNNSMQPPALCNQGQGDMGLNPQQVNPEMPQQLQMQQPFQNQSTSNPVLNDQCASAGNPPDAAEEARLEKKKQVLAQQQRRLMLLRHSKLCRRPDCTTKFCPQMTVLWKHLKNCKAKICPVPHCVSSRCVLSHHRNCKRKGLSGSCEICFPVKCVVQKLSDGGDDWNDDWDNFSVFEADPNPEGDPSATTTAATNIAANLNLSAIMSTSLLQAMQSQPSSLTDSQALLEDLQKKEQVLIQVRSQKGSLGGQHRVLLEQLSKSPNEEITTQLHNQMSLLGHLRAQFQRQEEFLVDQINRQTQMLQQCVPTASAAAPPPPPSPQISTTHTKAPQGKATKQRKPKPKEPKRPKTESSNESMPLLPPLLPPFSAEHVCSQNTETLSSSRKRSASQQSKGKKADKEPQRRKSLKKDGAIPASSFESGGPDAPSSSQESDIVSGIESKVPPTVEKNSPDTTGALSAMSAAAIKKHLDSLVSGTHLTPRCISKRCLPLVKKLLRDEHGWVFRDPVDPVALELENYFEVIKHPMDLRSVEKKLNDLEYQDLESFERETILVFDNAILFNGEDSNIGKWAKKLLDTFKLDMNGLVKGKTIFVRDTMLQGAHINSACCIV